MIKFRLEFLNKNYENPLGIKTQILQGLKVYCALPF
jgi:hypothetical protein